MSENGADAVGDSLRENMQMEKLKALRPMNIELGPQQARKPAAGRTDTKEVAKEIQDEVDDRVRDTEREKSKGPHCDALVEQIKASAAEEKTKSEFSPTTSSTPIEIFIQVHMKAKNLKRLTVKAAELADICQTRGIEVTPNLCVYTDSKSHSKLDLELRTGPEVLQKLREGGLSPEGGDRGGGGLPSLVPIERKAVKRNKVSNSQSQQKLLQDGSVYQGGLKEGKPHSFGSVTYAEGDPKQRVRFAGEFVDGVRTGKGCLVWRDGAQYAGEWFGDKPSGFGVENYPDGSSYVGQYEDDMRHGYGTYTFPSGAKYEGCWTMGKRQGRGLEQSKKGLFAVRFENNKRMEQTEFIPSQDDEFDRLIAKVRASVDTGRKIGDESATVFENTFQTKLRR